MEVFLLVILVLLLVTVLFIGTYCICVNDVRRCHEEKYNDVCCKKQSNCSIGFVSLIDQDSAFDIIHLEVNKHNIVFKDIDGIVHYYNGKYEIRLNSGL